MRHDLIVVNGDTDSISFKKPDQSEFTQAERLEILAAINAEMPKLIVWQDDDFFKNFIVVKAKNYVMLTEKGKLTIKGNSLKATRKEKRFKRFILDVVDLLLTDSVEHIYPLYMQCAREILTITDMTEWSDKHTVTKAVLTGKLTTQVRIREALKGTPVQEGDKKYLFFKTPTERCLLENFDGTYDASILLGKLYDTLCIFETVIDVKAYPNLTLKRNKHILEGLK